MPVKTRISEVEPFITADGSTIRELMHPDVHGNRNQSLAEATIAVGQITLLHKHINSEELYHVTQGKGEITLGKRKFPVQAGDTVFIQPGTPHQIRNTGDMEIKILCCCSPHYSRTDTELIE